MSDDVTNLAEVLHPLLGAHADVTANHVLASDWLANRDATNRLLGAARANSNAIAAYDDLVERVEALLVEAKRRDAMSLSCDFNGNRWESMITQADLRALIDPEATP